MILYPTETIYALGVNGLNIEEVHKLERFKGRGAHKSLSWLVRDIQDIAQYAHINTTASQIIERFMPGPVTLVLPAQEIIPEELQNNNTVSFRISSDPIAQRVIADYMDQHNAPLTCTSANVSGEEPASTVESILQQFADHNIDTSGINEVVDGGVRDKTNSTVIQVTADEKLVILREGAVSENTILHSIN